MTTYQQLIDRARQHCMTGTQDRLNALLAGIDADDTVLTFTDGMLGISSGSRISIGAEEMHVREVVADTATVFRGMNGSTPVSHTTDEIVRVNPQFSDFNILKSLNECILSLTGDGLWKVVATDFDFIPSISGYDLAATDIIDVLQVRYDTPGSTNNWPIIPSYLWTFDNNADTTDFPSGNQLVLKDGGSPGFKVRVTYKAALTVSTDPTANAEAATGLATSAMDIPPMGAAIRLNMGRDIKRTFLSRQPEPRRQEEVPPNSAQGAIQAMTRLYYMAIDREVRLLQRLYPQSVY